MYLNFFVPPIIFIIILNFKFFILKVFFLYLHLFFFIFLKVNLFHLYRPLTTKFCHEKFRFDCLILYCVFIYFFAHFQFFQLFLQGYPYEFSSHVQVLYVLLYQLQASK
jgi:hypothetical protein